MGYLKLLTYLFFFFTFHSKVFGQFTNENALKDSIISFTNDTTLNNFLFKHDLTNLDDITANLDSIIFRVNDISVDIFYKNLFGSDDNEIIMQIRTADYAYFVNIFYREKDSLFKVPSQILHYLGRDYGYTNLGMTFYFENIINSKLYSIITHRNYSYNRYTGNKCDIWSINKNSITSIETFDIESFTYSGLMTYEYSTKTSYRFKLINNSYPKKLFLDINQVSKNDMTYDDNGDEKGGTIKNTHIVSELSFRFINDELKISEVKNKNK